MRSGEREGGDIADMPWKQWEKEVKKGEKRKKATFFAFF